MENVKTEKTTKNKVLDILSKIGNVILWLFLAFAILMTTVVLISQDKTDLPSAFGKSLVSVQSDSMNPSFKEGDLIVVNMLTDEEKFDLKENDVITFYADLDGDGEFEINSHRIVGVRKIGGNTFYTTKGDNPLTNPEADKEEVSAQLVLGKWQEDSRIPGLGTVVDFLKTPIGFGVVIVIPLIAFFIYELYNFIVVLVSMKQKKLASVDEEEIKRRAIEEYIRQQAEEEMKKKKEEEE
jgi:signal peptidase